MVIVVGEVIRYERNHSIIINVSKQCLSLDIRQVVSRDAVPFLKLSETDPHVKSVKML